MLLAVVDVSNTPTGIVKLVYKILVRAVYPSRMLLLDPIRSHDRITAIPKPWDSGVAGRISE